MSKLKNIDEAMRRRLYFLQHLSCYRRYTRACLYVDKGSVITEFAIVIKLAEPLHSSLRVPHDRLEQPRPVNSGGRGVATPLDSSLFPAISCFFNFEI